MIENPDVRVFVRASLRDVTTPLMELSSYLGLIGEAEAASAIQDKHSEILAVVKKLVGEAE